MKRISEFPQLASFPALRRYRPEREYYFAMRGVKWGPIILACVMLVSPGLFFLFDNRIEPEMPTTILTAVVFAFVLAGLAAQFFKNRVVLSTDGVQIRKDFHLFFVRYADIEDVFFADSAEEVYHLPLEEGEYPMEFDVGGNNAIVLVLRQGTLSKSSAPMQDGICTRYVSFNLLRPERFLAFLRMRV